MKVNICRKAREQDKILSDVKETTSLGAAGIEVDEDEEEVGKAEEFSIPSPSQTLIIHTSSLSEEDKNQVNTEHVQSQGNKFFCYMLFEKMICLEIS